MEERPRPSVSVGNITEAELKEAMMGSPLTPTYAEQFGMTSAPLGQVAYQGGPSPAELEIEAEKALEIAKAEAVRARDQNKAPDPFNTTDDLEHWKKLLGKSENEKGALRKQNAEMAEVVQGLMAQFQEFQATQQMPPAGPQWQGPQPPMQQQFGNQPGYGFNPYEDPFDNASDEDLLSVKQLKKFAGRVFGPAMFEIQNQVQASQARAEALEQQIRRQAKLVAGISPMEEIRLQGKYPWVKWIPETQKLTALLGLKQAEGAMASTNGSALAEAEREAPLPPPPTETQRRILDKVTYVEGSRSADVPDTSEAALEAAKMRDYAKVLAAPLDTGEQAKLFRAFARKYNISGLAPLPSDLSH